MSESEVDISEITEQTVAHSPKFNVIFFFHRVEHARMHAKHKGHEAMHAEMVLILIVTLVVAQLILVQWKQRHPKSYNVRHKGHKLMFYSAVFGNIIMLRLLDYVFLIRRHMVFSISSHTI